MDIKDIFNVEIGSTVKVSGWVRNHRKQAKFGFIDLNDGTCMKSLQVVYNDELDCFEELTKLKLGSAITVEGKIIESPAIGQSIELELTNFVLEGDCDDDYPLQAKGRPTREYLREIAYLRPRTNLFRAVFRIRSVAAAAIHKYFQDNGYVYFHAPLITAADAEGAGEMFQVTTLDLDRIAKSGKVDYSKDFYGKRASLTVSGQLQAESFALAYKKTYTFGPTFRAENSNTKTHASEFWMIEPEIAFCDLNMDMDIMEDMLKYVVKYVLENSSKEIEFFDNFVEKGLKEKLEKLVKSKFERITHKEAIDLLIKSGEKFEFKPEYGGDLAKEHEKYITEYYNSPVFIYNWPKEIKAWYMKENADGETVAAVDLEVPGAGELMGGSEREIDLDVLDRKIKENGVDKESIDWYLNLRRFGNCYHSGFGLGLDRLLMYVTGMENIRDVIPFPRTPGNCDY